MELYSRLFENIENFKIKGLTKAYYSKLKKLGIHTLYDLFYYFPRDYEKVITNKEINKLLDGEQVVLEGVIDDISVRYMGKKLMITAIFKNQTGNINIVWFNNRYILSSLKNNMYIKITGKVRKSSKLQIINPSYKKIMIKDNSGITTFKNKSIYSLTSGVKQEKLSEIILNALDKYGYLLQENIPMEFLSKYKFISRQEAILIIHSPDNQERLNKAFKRLLYEEIIILEMYILYTRYINDINNKHLYQIENKKDLVSKYIHSLSFELTDAQKRVITSIYKELNEGVNINRLIQGDVGSGKTVVSNILMLYMVNNSYQVAMMAPTEILAKQHFDNFKKELESIDFDRICFLSSSIKGKKKKEILEKIKNGYYQIIIGTHSLIEDDVVFDKLGLIVIDEQHRFGVHQRDRLRNKGVLKNLIVMSATPIPRSLALTIYGDLDVSTISEMPKNRKEVKTKWVKNEKEISKMYNFITKKLEEKMQVYVVSPLIEESDKIEANSAMKTLEEYRNVFSKKVVELLHGKQKSSEKEEIINRFIKGEIDILISTTVIEVGINVINANIMVIRSANRFGLSTLHQLRGRVGRGKIQGYCFLEALITDDGMASERLSFLETTTDGFKISEKDLEMRKSGEIFGLKQSGISDLILVDLVKHIKEIHEIRDYIQKYLKENNGEIRNKYLLMDIKNKEEISKYKEE